jgi:hypothetical protein
VWWVSAVWFYRRLESQYSGPRATRSRRVRLLVDAGPSLPVTLGPDLDRLRLRLGL